MLPDAAEVLPKLATAGALGLLVGLQRERAHVQVAGFRTFTFIPVFGLVCALLAGPLGAWVVVAGLAAVVTLFVLGNRMMPPEHAQPGITTEIAGVLMFGLGAWLAFGSATVPVVVTGAVVLLLHLKKPLHDFAHRIGERDFSAILQFVLISLVILPILPDKAYGPFQVLNPHEIWLMVVLIVTLSLGGYLLAKAFGARAGTILGGVLGGIVSSTATTVSYARRTRTAPGGETAAALVILIASTIAFVRFIALVMAVAPQQAGQIMPPLAAMGGVMALVTLTLLPALRHAQSPTEVTGNPAELKTALVFGALYAVVILLVAVANAWLGNGALYLVAVISGTTDMDAITLSTARLMDRGQINAELGWRIILVAALANIAFKGGLAVVMGSRALAWRVVAAFAVALAGGGGIWLFWP